MRDRKEKGMLIRDDLGEKKNKTCLSNEASLDFFRWLKTKNTSISGLNLNPG
jgi:hypothetical protein